MRKILCSTQQKFSLKWRDAITDTSIIGSFITWLRIRVLGSLIKVDDVLSRSRAIFSWPIAEVEKKKNATNRYKLCVPTFTLLFPNNEFLLARFASLFPFRLFFSLSLSPYRLFSFVRCCIPDFVLLYSRLNENSKRFAWGKCLSDSFGRDC